MRLGLEIEFGRLANQALDPIGTLVLSYRNIGGRQVGDSELEIGELATGVV